MSLKIGDFLLLSAEQTSSQIIGEIEEIDEDFMCLNIDNKSIIFMRDLDSIYNDDDFYTVTKITNVVKETNENEEVNYKFNISTEESLKNPILATEMVWKNLQLIPPTCNCAHCVSNQIRVLENALETVPVNDYVSNFLCLHIQDVMLPNLREELQRQTHNVRSLLNMFGFEDDSQTFERILNLSFNEEPQRICLSKENIEKTKKLIKPFVKKEQKHSKCCICMSEVEEGKLVVTCPKCEQVFCGEKDQNCGGFFEHTKLDHHCPCCRSQIEDWLK
jgi:hypothetical protein